MKSWQQMVCDLTDQGFSMGQLSELLHTTPQVLSEIKAGRSKEPRGMLAVRLHNFHERKCPTGERNQTSQDFTVTDRQLIEAACAAREHAHAPWSRFKVGAAARFGDEIVHGCNVEFDVYGLTNCAERTAVFAAYARGAARKKMTAIAVVADTPHPVSPCGACRQVMFECGGADLRVILANTQGDAHVVRMADLLPGGFQLDPETPVQTAAKGDGKSNGRSRARKSEGGTTSR